MNTRTRVAAGCAVLIAAAGFAVTAGPAGAIPSADYVIDCTLDDQDGYATDDRDERTIEITEGATITIAVSGCDWYYSSGEIDPVGAGVNITGTTQLFTVTGAASFNTYVAGLYGFVWYFETPPPPTTTTTVVETTTTVAVTTTTITSPDASGSTQDAVVAGDSLTVTGKNWASRTAVNVVLRSDPVALGTVTTHKDGTFSETFTLPDDLAAGTHHVNLNGLDANGNMAHVSLEITVDAAPIATTTTAAVVTAPTLPPTGNGAGSSAMVAVLVLFGGALLVSAARRPVRND